MIFGNSYFQGTPLSGCLCKMEVCNSCVQLSVIKYCCERFDLRCDKIPGSAFDYLLCLGLSLLVLSIKVHQFWLKIKFHFLLSLLSLLSHLDHLTSQLTDTAKTYIARPPPRLAWHLTSGLRELRIEISRFLCVACGDHASNIVTYGRI